MKIMSNFTNNNEGNKEAVSSGGVVVSRIGDRVHILLVRDNRYEDWVCPKGHVEAGETLEQAALRELQEEAGVTDAKILSKLGTFRRFVQKADEWKTIHYFLILTTPDQPLGSYESEHTETKWFPVDELPKLYLPEQLQVITDNIDIIKNV